jgi:hypothetical protein
MSAKLSDQALGTSWLVKIFVLPANSTWDDREGYCVSPYAQFPSSNYLFIRNISTADAGSTFYIDSSINLGLPLVFALMQDGSSLIDLCLEGVQNASDNQGPTIQSLLGGASAVNPFLGYDLDYITVTITKVMTTPAPAPNGQYVDLSAAVNVFGHARAAQPRLSEMVAEILFGVTQGGGGIIILPGGGILRIPPSGPVSNQIHNIVVGAAALELSNRASDKLAGGTLRQAAIQMISTAIADVQE